MAENKQANKQSPIQNCRSLQSFYFLYRERERVQGWMLQQFSHLI